MKGKIIVLFMALSVLLMAMPTNANLEDDIFAYYTADSTNVTAGGALLLDVFNNNDMSEVGATASSTTAIINQSRLLGPSNDYYEITGGLSEFAGDKNWTITLWSRDVGGGGETMMANNVGGASQDGFRVNKIGSDVPGASIIEAGVSVFTAEANFSMLPNIFYFSVLTWNEETSTGNFYIDDIEYFDVRGGNIPAANNEFTIGVNTNAGSDFDGQLDEIGLWERVLTREEISNLYNNGNALYYQEFANSDNFTISANINNFIYNISGSESGSTTTGIVVTNLLKNDTTLYDINVTPNNENYTKTFVNHVVNVSLQVDFPDFNLNATDPATGLLVERYNLTLSKDSQGYSQTFEITNFNFNRVLVDELFNITLSKSGYFNKTLLNQNVTFNITTVLTQTDDLFVEVFELPPNTILNQNTTLTVQDATTQTIFVIQNGTGAIGGLVIGENYTLIFNSAGFEQVTYAYTHTQVSAGDGFDAFMFPVGTQEVSITVQNQNTEVVAGVRAVIEKFVGGVFTVVADKNTDVTGLVSFNLIQGDTHRVTLTRDGYTTRTFETIWEELNIPVILLEDSTVNFDNPYTGINFNLAPGSPQLNLSVHTIVFTINADQDNLESWGLRLYNNNTLINDTTIINDADGGTVMLNFNGALYNGSSIVAHGFFTKTGFSEEITARSYIITPLVFYQGTILEAKDFLADNDFFGTGDKIIVFIILSLTTMAVLALFVTGLSNLIATSVFSLFYAWLLGVNLLIAGVYLAIVIMMTLAFGGKK